MCCCKLPLPLNDFPHTLKSNAFTPVWVTPCLLRWYCEMRLLAHDKHWYGFLQHVKIYALPCHLCFWNTYYRCNIENMIYLCAQICGFQVAFPTWKTSYILSSDMISLLYEFSSVASSYSCHWNIFHKQNMWKHIHLHPQYCDTSSGISN
jgi:hypothetical protein